MIIISRNLVLSQLSTTDPNSPRIGYRTVVNIDNVSSDSAQETFPISNVTNPQTNSFWKSDTLDDQSVTVVTGRAERVDYIGIANHNFGSGGIAYKVQSSEDGVTWDDDTDERIPENDNPIMHLFEQRFRSYYRLRLFPSLTLPKMAVMYMGKILSMQRRIYVGHTPITLGRVTALSNNRSEKGQFLGRTVRREYNQSTAKFSNISPDWYRSSFDPFVEAARTLPFFWAWRPYQYPREVGYCWLTGDITPTNQRPNGMMQMQFNMQGIGKFVAESSIDDTLLPS